MEQPTVLSAAFPGGSHRAFPVHQAPQSTYVCELTSSSCCLTDWAGVACISQLLSEATQLNMVEPASNLARETRHSRHGCTRHSRLRERGLACYLVLAPELAESENTTQAGTCGFSSELRGFCEDST